jgi:hypothetical protein
MTCQLPRVLASGSVGIVALRFHVSPAVARSSSSRLAHWTQRRRLPQQTTSFGLPGRPGVARAAGCQHTISIQHRGSACAEQITSATRPARAYAGLAAEFWRSTFNSTALGHNRGRSGTNGVGGADFEHDTARSPQMNHQPLILRVSDAGNC